MDIEFSKRTNNVMEESDMDFHCREQEGKRMDKYLGRDKLQNGRREGL